MHSNNVWAASEHGPVDARSEVAAQQPSIVANCAAHKLLRVSLPQVLSQVQLSEEKENSLFFGLTLSFFMCISYEPGEMRTDTVDEREGFLS
jgi:hypothetical protein